MGVYGPFTATVGTIQQCSLSTDAQGVYVRNTSRYDLALAFASSQPVNTTNFGGMPWAAVIPSGDRTGLRIPLGIYGANGFPGYVWILPLDQTTSLAITGTVSGNASFYIESYTDASLMPADYASPQYVNAASQERTISLPMPVGGDNGGGSVGGGVFYATSLATSASAATPLTAFNLTAAQLAANQVVFYLTHVSIGVEVAGFFIGELQIQYMKSGSPIGSPTTWHRFQCAASATNQTAYPWCPCIAHPIVLVCKFSTGTVDAMRTQVSPIATAPRLSFDVTYAVDFVNTVPPAPYGNWSVVVAGQGGAIF